MGKHILLQVYHSDVETQIFFRKLWSLSLVPHEDIVSTFMKIVSDAPVWEENDEDAGAGEQLNDGMRNVIAYYERTWIGAPANKTCG